MVQERFFSWVNLFSIFVLSLLVYFVYVWGSNFTPFSSTSYSMEVIFESAHYYLSVFVSVMICFLFDLFVESWRFEVLTSPPALLRKIVNRDLDLQERRE